MARVRTFIAIELDEPSARALAALQARLKRAPAASLVRWVAAENIHLTLKFLGDTDAHRIPALRDALVGACSGTAPFVLQFEGVGAFPDLNKPNVVWVGVRGEVEEAIELARKLEDACAELGFVREARPFSPHLTLGRVKRDVDGRERARVGEMIASAGAPSVSQCRVERVSVMRSDLRPGGSIYTRLAAIGLGEHRAPESD